MTNALVRIEANVHGGFQVTCYWGEGESMDREIYGEPYNTHVQAEVAGKALAAREGMRFQPYEPRDHEASARRVQMIKDLRAAGYSLPEAVKLAHAA